jgi:uncharacterized SAM-binding protein YcdF (DUF218 family)
MKTPSLLFIAGLAVISIPTTLLFTSSLFIIFLEGILSIALLFVHLMHRARSRSLGIYLKNTAIAFLVFFVLTEALIIAYPSFPQTDEMPKYVIILGAGGWGDRLSPILMDRMDTAVDYHVTHPSTIFIVSGGQGEDEWISEATAMKAHLLTRGIPESSIIMEDRATSTQENITYSKEILENLDMDFSKPVGILTSDFHILRSTMIARSYAMNVQQISATTPRSYLFKFLFREFFALVKSVIFDLNLAL